MLEVFFPAAHTIILLGRFLTFAHKQRLLFKLREDTDLQGTVSIPPAQSVHESTEFYTFHHGSGDRLWGTLTTETRWTETGRGCWDLTWKGDVFLPNPSHSLPLPPCIFFYVFASFIIK